MEINGKELAQRIYADLKEQVLQLNSRGIIPHLVVLLVGNNPSSIAYVNQKKKWAEVIGAKVTIEKYADTIEQSTLEERIIALNSDSTVHAVLVQIPLPPHLNPTLLTELVDPKKDIDGFHPESPFMPPLAAAVLTILQEIMKREGETGDVIPWLQTKNIVLLGKGKAGGKPVHSVLSKHAITHVVIDSKTENRETQMQDADIIISAVGKKRIVTDASIKKGVILIGVGMNLDEQKKLYGDYEVSEIQEKASYYTPTPGGVGPVNVAELLSNLITAAKTQ